MINKLKLRKKNCLLPVSDKSDKNSNELSQKDMKVSNDSENDYEGIAKENLHSVKDYDLSLNLLNNIDDTSRNLCFVNTSLQILYQNIDVRNYLYRVIFI